MKNIKIAFCILSLGLFLTSCSSSSEPDIIDPVDPIDTSTKTTYDKNVKTIIDNSCATSACHDTTNPANGLRLTSYSEVKNAASSGNLISRMNNSSNPMPASGKLNTTTLAVIDKWKADGFLEN
ncbi:hypothetical protein [Tenacibaculum ovolyticum]|uniref:hypothetical protein n=1 Tax=Tenacibaculum ovolyticum TaxID=104270 RepID=UPI003BAA2160